MQDFDYQAVKVLASSEGWKIIKSELQERIEKIEKVLLDTTLEDMTQKMSPEEYINLLNYKKMERTYLKELQNLPQQIINTKIKIPLTAKENS